MSIHSPDLLQMPPDLREMIQAELAPGEKIAWTSQPNVNRHVRQAFPILIFALFWNAMAVFFFFAVTLGHANMEQEDSIARYIPCFFMVVGLGLLSMPYWHYRNALRTAYVLTDRRAIVFDGGFSTTIRSFTPDQLSDLSRTEWRDGTGNLVFRSEFYKDAEGHSKAKEYGFMAVDEVKAVEERVRTLVRTAPKKWWD